MVPQYAVNGPKLVKSYLNGTLTSACLLSIRKIKIPLDGTVGSIFGPDFDASQFQNSKLTPFPNLQFVEICDEPGLQGLPNNNNTNNTNNTNVMNIHQIVNQNTPDADADPSHQVTSSPSSLDEDYFTEQGRVASFLNCVTTAYTRIILSSTVVSTLSQLDSFDLLPRIRVLDIAVQFYELPRDDFDPEDTQNDLDNVPIKVSHEGIWFLNVALTQMSNLETLALTDRIFSSSNHTHFNNHGAPIPDDLPPNNTSLPSPEIVSSIIAPVIVPIWQALLFSSSPSPLTNLKELTLPNCFCQFITPDLIPASVEVLTLNTFFPALFTSRSASLSNPGSFQSTAFQNTSSDSTFVSDHHLTPHCCPSVSKLALNVGYEGIKLAFPQVIASGSNSSAASAAAAVQVIPVTPSPSPNESGTDSFPFQSGSARQDSRQNTQNASETQSCSLSTKPWTSELTALQIWMPPWLQNNNAGGGINIFDRNQDDNQDTDNDDQNNVPFEPNTSSNNNNSILPPSPLFPHNPQLSSAANAARIIPRGRVSLGDVFLQQVTFPLLSPKLVYLVLSCLPVSLLESLPDYCPKLEVLLVENWDYTSQTPVSRIINASNYHVYYTQESPKPQNRILDQTAQPSVGEENNLLNGTFEGSPQNDYPDEYNDYDLLGEDADENYEDDEDNDYDDDDYDDEGKTYTVTVAFINQKLDDFYAAAAASGRADLPNTYEVYRTLRHQFTINNQPSAAFNLNYDGYHALLESINALDVIKSLLASEDDLDDEAAGDEAGNDQDIDLNEDPDNNPIEPGYAVGVTHLDLANASAVSDTAAAMFLGMARVNYLSPSEIAQLDRTSGHETANGLLVVTNGAQPLFNNPSSPDDHSALHALELEPSQPFSDPPHTTNTDDSSFEDLAGPASRKRHSVDVSMHGYDQPVGLGALHKTEDECSYTASDAAERDLVEHTAKRRRCVSRGKPKPQTELINALAQNMRLVWSSDKSIEKVLEQLTGGYKGARSRVPFMGPLGSSRLRKGKTKSVLKQRGFTEWLESRFSEHEQPDPATTSLVMQNSRFFSRQRNGEMQQGEETSSLDAAADALASAAALASAEAYDRIMFQNAQDEQSLIQINQSLINLVKKCGRTLQFVYLPIDPNTIHAATLSFMVCYCMLVQRNQRRAHSQAGGDVEMENGEPGSEGGDGVGLKLYVKYPLRQPAQLIRSGMGLTKEDLTDTFLAPEADARPQPCAGHDQAFVSEAEELSSFAGGGGRDLEMSDAGRETSLENGGSDDRQEPGVRFPMTSEQLRACVKRGTGMSPLLFKEMSQSLYDTFSCASKRAGGRAVPDKCAQDGGEASAFAMAKLLAATDPTLTPLEACSVSSRFSSCPPSQIWFGHRRHQSLSSSVAAEDPRAVLRDSRSAGEWKGEDKGQQKVQHESYPLFKVYEYLVKTHSPALNNCIYRVTI